MTYQAELKKRIAELEAKIALANDSSDLSVQTLSWSLHGGISSGVKLNEINKLELEKELNRLKLAEFEEDLQEEGKQSLLKE
jgi:hypothetical protein